MDAEKYDKKWSSYLEKTHENVIRTLEDHLERKDNIKLLDVSTGTAKIYEKLLESDLSFERIAFNDINPSMLSETRKEEIRQAFDCEIDFENYEAKDLKYVNETFDVVISVSAYHLYPMKYNFFEEVDRVLKHRGYLLILDWNKEGWFKPIHWLIDKFTEEDLKTETSNEIIQRANKRWFNTILCNTWRWRWWNFFTILLQKYDDDFLKDTEIPDETEEVETEESANSETAETGEKQVNEQS